MWHSRSLKVKVPMPASNPGDLKGLAPPELLTPKEEEEAAHSAGWHITLGHLEKRGAENSLCEFCEWKWSYRHQNENGVQSLPNTESTTWALAGSLAPVVWPQSSGRDSGHLCQ